MCNSIIPFQKYTSKVSTNINSQMKQITKEIHLVSQPGTNTMLSNKKIINSSNKFNKI